MRIPSPSPKNLLSLLIPVAAARECARINAQLRSDEPIAVAAITAAGSTVTRGGCKLLHNAGHGTAVLPRQRSCHQARHEWRGIGSAAHAGEPAARHGGQHVGARGRKTDVAAACCLWQYALPG